MKKVIIFGAGELGKQVYGEIKNEYDVVAFIDNYVGGQGEHIFNCPVYKLEEAMKIIFDFVFICSTTGFDSMKNQLAARNVPEYKIIDTHSRDQATLKRKYLKDFVEISKINNLKGNVAEAGVFQGEYAKFINEYFPDRTLYLFDTFEGFDERDRNDIIDTKTNGESLYDVFDYLKMTSIDIVLSKTKFPGKCEIKQGYFPTTTYDLEDSFLFVSLDRDLYKPTFEGLKFFYPRMVEGGIIVMDDYFQLKGVRQAVEDYFNENP